MIALNLRNFPPYFNIISTLYTRERKGGSWHSFTPLCPTLSHSLIGNPPFFESPPPIFLILHVVSSSYMSHFNLHPFLPPPPTIYTPISHSPLSPTHSLTHLHHLSYHFQNSIHTPPYKPFSTTYFLLPQQNTFQFSSQSFQLIASTDHSPWHHQQQTLGLKPHSLLFRHLLRQP